MKNNVCPKIGIKIRETNNEKQYPIINNMTTKVKLKSEPKLDTLDLELDNYSLEDLYRLFNIQNSVLDHSCLKEAKNIVLKMHPDKSRLDSKYFLFFSKAYKRLYSIYEFQNKSTNKIYKDKDFYSDDKINILTNLFETNKDLKDPKNFNQWFNKNFEKARLEDPNQSGYGEWLKSDEGIINIDENVTKSNMNDIFEQKKKQIQALSVYTGVTNSFSSNLGGSLLNGGDNFTTDSYTDLRQAYTETLIPVTHEDYDRMPKYKNVGEYKARRDTTDTTPLSKQESESILMKQYTELEQNSAALAYKYAQDAEKAKQKQNSFWSDLQQITNIL